MKTYIFYTDPGHGWLAVKRAELEKLGILDKISHFSYQRGGTVYLEEDCDANVFLMAHLKTSGTMPKMKTSHTDRHHPIRGYASFDAATIDVWLLHVRVLRWTHRCQNHRF